MDKKQAEKRIKELRKRLSTIFIKRFINTNGWWTCKRRI